jgi:hypothetical protein
VAQESVTAAWKSLSHAVEAFSREKMLACQLATLSVLLMLLIVHAACLMGTLMGASEADSSDGGQPVVEDLTGCASDGSSCDRVEVAAVRTRHRRAAAGCNEPEDDGDLHLAPSDAGTSLNVEAPGVAEGARREDTERVVEALRAESAKQKLALRDQAELIAALRARAEAAEAELRSAASPVGET